MSSEQLSYHEVQAMVGASSAHPGGFTATLEFLGRAVPSPALRILECGCGTGRTACHLARLGHTVTGLDRNPVMLAKARRRAEAEGVEAVWIEGDVQELPFPDASFDLVLAESVTVFAPMARTIREYWRVLVPGGRAADLEMAVRPGIPAEARAELLDFYGALDFPTVNGWREAYAAAGFDPVVLWGPQAIDLSLSRENRRRFPDRVDLSDSGAAEDPRVKAVMGQNALLLLIHASHLAYLGIVGTRPDKEPGV